MLNFTETNGRTRQTNYMLSVLWERACCT